jgi:hypothetical protein
MLRRSSTGFSLITSSPSISIVPLVGSTIRLIIRRIVVLPLPEEPTRTVIVRDGITKEKSSTATVPSGNSFVTERNSIMCAAHSSNKASDQHRPVVPQPKHGLTCLAKHCFDL